MDLVAGPPRVVVELGRLLKKEYNLQTGVRKKITSLSRDLESMHTALQTVAEVPPEQLDMQVKLWARDVQELSYDAEDIVDRFLVCVSGREARDPNRFKRAAKKIGKLFSKSKARHQIDSMIKIIDEQAKELAERRDKYKVDQMVAKRAPSSTIDPRLKAIFKEDELVGIRESSSELVSMLSLQGDNKSTNKTMKTVSVVGAGGLGKTTLAKAVHDKLKVDYDCQAFVPVGRNPDMKNVFRDILIELDNKYMDINITLLHDWQLIKQIREYLGSKRYFIIIDDVWEIESWETIKLAFVQNNSGSRLIITTRNLEVAIAAGDVYKLKPLPFDKSKKLFYTRIFGAEGKCPDNQIDEVSNKILKKCDGVPLAIITMSSLLLGKSREQWIEVCDSIVFRDKDNKEVSDTEWILSLSYYDLPADLKTCLLYLSAFPEDHVIDKDSLIWKWVAEGFVHNKPRTGYFEVGEGYFYELINRSMIQPVGATYSYGLITGCRIHDMVLDLLRVKSHEENFVTIPYYNNDESKVLSPRRRVRRLAHQNRAVEQIHQDNQMDLRHTRTFVAFRCAIINERVSFLSFRLLRVLALEECHLENSLHLENLIHLRYLGLRETEISELPQGIGAMKFLQTLNLFNSLLDTIPSSIGQLTQLMCLRAGMADVPNVVIEKLTSLEELQLRVLKGTIGKRQFLQGLGNLHELRVLNALLIGFNDKSMELNLVESLGNLHNIRHLTLEGNTIYPDKAIWDTLVLPRQLRRLSLNVAKFSVLPSCINPSDLPNLCYLRLQMSTMDEHDLEMLGGLPELRHLHLTLWSGVTITIHPADGCFQKLRTLELSRSSVWFVLNEDLSVSFTLWNSCNPPAFGSETRDECITAPPVIMADLEVLVFQIDVRDVILNNVSYDNFGLEYLPSLLKVIVTVWRYQADKQEAAEAKKLEAALRHAIQIHPNRATLQIITGLRFSSTTGVSVAR